MSIYAVVENKVVVNLIEWDGVSEYDPGNKLKLVITDDVFVDIGSIYDGKTFTPKESK